jgi:Holliday junction resolvasome RuvABC endonuclease subunit
VRVLALDLSTSIGWALLTGEGMQASATLLDYGVITTADTIPSYGDYPWSYLVFSKALAEMVGNLARTHEVDVIVIEETNLGKQRYSQKALEFIHFAVLQELGTRKLYKKVRYVSSSEWRRALNLSLTREDKKLNSKLSRAKSKARATRTKLDKKALGIRGRINKKHVALRYVNSVYNLGLKVKDDDIADAICLGLSVFAGAETCDGT